MLAAATTGPDLTPDLGVRSSAFPEKILSLRKLSGMVPESPHSKVPSERPFDRQNLSTCVQSDKSLGQNYSTASTKSQAQISDFYHTEKT
jgi:hypothetical protein